MGSAPSRNPRTRAPDAWPPFPRLASSVEALKPRYDVVVVGSGYGASIAASRCARAGQSVCVLERGKEWHPGQFPETFRDAAKETQTTFGGKKEKKGKANKLFDFFFTDDLTVIQGSGLGGTSLINANVALDADPAVFQDSVWPKELQNDIGQMMNVDRKHFFHMIKPRPYPDNYPQLHKIDRMKEALGGFDIEDLDKILYKTPLFVTFEDKRPNHVGVPQPRCTACGNCVAGCNVGAKNTLNTNFLPDAKAHGAEIFTEVEVTAVLKAQNSTGWIVGFQRVDDDNSDEVEHYVQATRVILGAGSLGSTKILLRSKERGLPVSDELGKRFSTNGDVLATSFNGDHFANTVGVETKDLPHTKHPPGPTITAVADFSKVVKGSFENHFVLEDFNPPSMFAGPYSVALPFAADLIGIEKYPSNEMFERIFQRILGESIDNSLTFLGISHDAARGVISLEDGVFDITWEGVGSERNFNEVNKAIEKMTAGLEGTFVKNPLWLESLGRSVATGHPLGGCPMGDSGKTGVVNHAGQVFYGSTDRVMEGLMVVDGAIVPRALAVNPALTISILAERCIRLLAKREGWRINYDTFKPLRTRVTPRNLGWK
ncbi:cholesterol oxidase-like [Montipora capricornis]|uniref:cholesterol oxidase-like n=1 Tax=Montipora capricornis TaxID=246305 RepID=UPI0035F1F2CE